MREKGIGFLKIYILKKQIYGVVGMAGWLLVPRVAIRIAIWVAVGALVGNGVYAPGTEIVEIGRWGCVLSVLILGKQFHFLFHSFFFFIHILRVRVSIKCRGSCWEVCGRNRGGGIAKLDLEFNFSSIFFFDLIFLIWFVFLLWLFFLIWLSGKLGRSEKSAFFVCVKAGGSELPLTATHIYNRTENKTTAITYNVSISNHHRRFIFC